LASRAESRNLGRGLARLNTNSSLCLAQVDAVADKQAAKVEATVYVAKRGMDGVGLLSQLEQQLTTLIPGSANRVSYVADRAVLDIAELVSDTVRELRRI
jgi:hypothetical protein